MNHKGYLEPIYVKEDGVYVLYTNGRSVRIPIGPQVGICFSQSDGETILHKHGVPKHVNDWAIEARKSLVENKTFLPNLSVEMAENIIVIESDSIPVEELNKIISTSGYIKYFLKKYMQ